MKKKHLLFGAVALIVVAACSDSSSVKEIEDPVLEIGFKGTFVEHSTKAIVPGPYTTANFETTGNTMGVFGWKIVTSPSAATTQVFDDQSVNYNVTTTDDWGYTPKKYWDANADHYAFFAYAPHSADFTGTVAMSSNSATTFKITDFVQSTTVASQIDLLTDLTSQVNNVTNKTASPRADVSFTFSHILSKVNILMKVSTALKNDSTDNPVTVVSVQLNNAIIDGSYAYSTDWTWTRGTNTNDFAATQTDGVVFGSNVLTTTATNVPALVDMLLIPGTVSDDYTITVEYKIGNEVFDRTIKLTAFKDATDANVTTWQNGFEYNYVLTIGPDPIEFDLVGVETWTDGGTYTYTIE